MPSEARAPRDLIPLTPAVYNVLLSLGEGSLHGYGIMQTLEKKSEGRESLLPGSLYATLARMTEDGLIQEAPPPEDADARRKYYRVTDFGKQVARAESDRLRMLLGLAREAGLAAEAS